MSRICTSRSNTEMNHLVFITQQPVALESTQNPLTVTVPIGIERNRHPKFQSVAHIYPKALVRHTNEGNE